MAPYLFFLAFVLIVIIVVAIMVVFCKKCSEKYKLKQKFREKRSNLMWNDTIKTLKVSYFPTCMSLFAKVQFLVVNPNPNELMFAILIFVWLIAQIIISYTILLINRDNFKTFNFIRKYGYYMQGIRTRCYLYEPIFMLTKLFFVLVPMVKPLSDGNEVQILLFVHSLFIIWYGTSEPHKLRS